MMVSGTRRVIVALVVLCAGTGTSFAQLAPNAGMPTLSPGLRRQPGVSTAAPPPGLAVLTPLGGIQLSLGSLVVPSQFGALGAVGACPAPGIAISPTSTPTVAAFDAANGIIPVSPAGTAPAFGTTSLSSACNPIVPGSSPETTASPDPNAAAAFTDGALPLATVESGSPGFSPSIVVPSPSDVATSESPASTSAATDQLMTATPPAISSSGCAGDAACGAAQ